VTLLVGSRTGATKVGEATSDPAGQFTISYAKPAGGVLYVEATPGGTSRLRLRSVAGIVGSTTVARPVLDEVRVNELTTVATSYALAQFSGTEGIHGASPGLENAAATAFNLADSSTGEAGEIVTNANNGDKNATLATLGTLANLVSVCAAATPKRCDGLLEQTTPPGGDAPVDTARAIVDLARNPTLSPAGLYALARTANVYEPVLDAPPTAWILVLLYTDTDLYASGRIAIDAKGNVWSSTNWQPGTQDGSTSVSVLDPVGGPTLGSPIEGGGMKGGAWGAAIAPDGTVWMGSFGGAALIKYSPTGTILSPDGGYTDGGLNHPQGIAVDQKGNVWIANNYGPESAPGQGNVVVYPGGDPSKAMVITGGGLNHPFAVQIDGYGRAWVTNAGPGGAKLVGTRAAIAVGKFGGSVTVIGPDFEPTSFSPIENDSCLRSTRRTTPGLRTTSAARSPRSRPTEQSPACTGCRAGRSHGRKPSTAPIASGWPGSPGTRCGSSAARRRVPARPARRPGRSCRPSWGSGARRSSTSRPFRSTRPGTSG
jgi:hypothetical protein